MVLIQCQFFLYFILIFLSRYQSSSVYSIQCCTGDDNSCSSKPVDCPSNVCFKLVINKVTEERGCLDDLLKLLNFQTKDSRKLNDGNSLSSGTSTNDQCHKLGTHANGMSLCKCTTNLCNLSTRQITFSITYFIFKLFFLHVFLQII